MPLWGLDVSDYQPVIDGDRAVNEGFDFIIAKASEGTGWRAKTFSGNLDQARSSGLVFAAYHYVRAGDPAAEVRNIRQAVPLDVPLILDVESGSGTIDHIHDLMSRLADVGYRLPLVYFPEWYWGQIGYPDLSALPPLWASHYPDNAGGTVSGIYQRVPADFWNGYGGNRIEILQFTSSAHAIGISPIDGNAYRGDRGQLENLINGEDDVDQTERKLLDRVYNQFTGSWKAGEFAGWEPFVQDWEHGNRTLLDLIRETDKWVYLEAEESAGEEAAFQSLIEMLNSDEGADKDTYQARVAEATRRALKDNVAQVQIRVSTGGDDGGN